MTEKYLEVFRIVTQRHVADTFSGEGARLYGGRWNPQGLRAVYTASSRSLAILEMLVQDQPLSARYVIVPARIPSTVRIDRSSASTLPRDWATAGRTNDLWAIGAEWIKCAKTAILRVPSAVGRTNSTIFKIQRTQSLPRSTELKLKH